MHEEIAIDEVGDESKFTEWVLIDDDKSIGPALYVPDMSVIVLLVREPTNSSSVSVSAAFFAAFRGICCGFLSRFFVWGFLRPSSSSLMHFILLFLPLISRPLVRK